MGHDSHSSTQLQVAACTVTEFSLADALSYQDYVTDRLRAHPGPAEAALRWVVDRDNASGGHLFGC